ncbi:MAG: AraC family transcriptional regulator [Proteobacteria bacterium]|nr:AraC family transcriptional regulator [Pseudomonadota bacterium]
MQKGQDIAVRFNGLFLVHHNLPGSDVKAHSHPEHHLIIPLQGEVTIELEGRRLTCGPGRMIYVSPNTSHIFKSAREKGERLICMIDPIAWKKAEGERFDSVVLPASQLCKEILVYLLVNPKTKNVNALIDTFVRTCLELLEVTHSNSELSLDHIDANLSRPELRKAMSLAREHFSEDFTVAELARRSGLSVRNLSRLFQQELGMSPKHLLMRLRIDRAKELLLAGEMTITETAFEVGYQSLSQFISAFRQLTGQIPSEFASSQNVGRKGL